MLALPDPSGQPISNRMIPGGGNAQTMATRHSGAPNGMCEYSSLIKVQVPLYDALFYSSSHPDSSCYLQTLTGQHQHRQRCPVTAEGSRKQTNVDQTTIQTGTLVNSFISHHQSAIDSSSVSHRFRLTRAGTARLSVFDRQ